MPNPSTDTTRLLQRLRRGFTLIEMMIVVAVVGILAALAIPAYQHYIVKTQISRGFWEASNYKTAVEERLHNGVFVFPDPAGTLGYVRSTLTAADDTFAFNADGSGAIVVLLNGDVHPVVRGARITVGRLTSGGWTCAVRGDGLTSMVLPPGCTLDG
ncbi:pilin [Cupriavidus campinensis]|uniref:pilin n=1 Tax=Cupriavidus campinensis TaxID=151783 RepID=UPI0024C43707|nr:pilin [Cupriavidus campinensis]